MTHAISVPTPFNDISELGESFASRVDAERLMLPHAEPVPEGEWVQFAVTLADGSAALSGVGRCKQSFDNGEDRDPEYRYEVEMDSLQFDEMAQIYFERLLQVRAAQFGEEPPTGEIELPPESDFEERFDGAADAGYAEPAPLADPYEASSFEPPTDTLKAIAADEIDELTAGGYDEPYTDAGDVAYEDGAEDAFEAAAPPPARERVDAPPPELQAPAESAIYDLPPPTPPGVLPSPHATAAVITRRLVFATWSPEPMERREPNPSSGYFELAVGADLPRPSAPPRPDLDPSMRVKRAPQPGDEGPIATAAPRRAPAQTPDEDEGYEMESGEVEAEEFDEAYGDPETVQAEVGEFDEDEPMVVDP